MRSTASGGHGDRSDTLTPSSTRRSCARPTTSICRRSLRSIPTSGRMSDCLRAIAHWRRQARSPRSILRSASSSTTRCATSGCRGAELPPDKKARLKAVDEELASLSSRYEDNVLDATNAWDSCIDDAAHARRRAIRCAGRRTARRRRRRQARLEVVAADALLSAGHAVRRESQSARDAVSRIRHARKRVRQIRMGQQHDHRTRARTATRSRRTARLRELCGGVARAQDGAHARRRCSPSSATSP